MKQVFIFLMSFLVTTTGFTNDEDLSCENSKNINDLFQCLVEKNPQTMSFQNELKARDFGVEQGKQRPNPSIGVQSIAGQQYGQNVSETTFQYLHTFQLGGKREARIKRAQAEVAATQAESYGNMSNVSTETALRLYRLQQNLREMSIVIETIDTFKKILRNYNTRAALTPEQKVSKNVFEFAIKDYENQKISLATEQTEIESFFNALNLVSFTKVTSFVQSLTFNVEAVENRFTSVLKDKNERGPELQLATAQLKLASADYSLEKSQVWGDLSIGPIYQYRYEEGSGFPVIGIGLTLPLPLYNQNSGGTQRAAYELKSAEYLQQYATKKIQSEWIMLDNAFKQIAANIKQQPSKSEIEKKHHELEGLFYRGLVPSSLIVEAHRQLLDLTQSQHEQQLKCLQLLYRSFALNGELPKEYL